MSYKLGIHISCSILESATAISHELFNFASCHWTATTSKHNSCCHDFGNCHWLLIVQPANTTGIENSKYNEINNMHRLHLPQLVLQFPFPLGSHFPPPLTTRYTIVSTFHVAIPIATRFTFPTAIDYSNQQTQRHSQFMSHFPLPLVHYC